MAAELSVGFLRTQNLAKRISVHSDLTLVGLPQKLVKEGGRDPRLKDHPSSEVDPANLVIEGECVLVFHAGHGFVHGNEMGILRPAFGDGSCRLESRTEECNREHQLVVNEIHLARLIPCWLGIDMDWMEMRFELPPIFRQTIFNERERLVSRTTELMYVLEPAF